jgi:TolB-like protein
MKNAIMILVAATFLFITAYSAFSESTKQVSFVAFKAEGTGRAKAEQAAKDKTETQKTEKAEAEKNELKANTKSLESAVESQKSAPGIKTIDNYVAIFDFEVRTGDKDISRLLADKVIHVFTESNKYEVIDRGNMNKILGEQKFQMSGCVAQECKVEAGQILGVGKIVNGSLGIIGKTYYLTLQMIDVKTGKVEISAEDECKCEIDELLGSTRRLAKRLLGEEVKQTTVSASGSKNEATFKVEAASKAIEIARDGRFVAYDNGTVIDTRTGLMWAARDNGSNINWHDAKNYCENYSGGGYSDWRIPIQDELAGLYDPSKHYQSECKSLFFTLDQHLTELIRLTCSMVWASETRGSQGAFFGFDNGHRGVYPHPGWDVGRALPVRSGK